MRELLRVVTALKGPSALSSSFNSRTSLKNLKMELKLVQEVSSCLSVPKCKRQRQMLGSRHPNSDAEGRTCATLQKKKK